MLTNEQMQAVAQIANEPFLQTLIFKGHFDLARKLIAAPMDSYVECSGEEIEILITTRQTPGLVRIYDRDNRLSVGKGEVPRG